MRDRLAISSIHFGDLFKLLLIAGSATWVALGLLGGLFGLISPSAITINGEAAASRAQALAIVPAFAIIGTIFSAIGATAGALVIRIIGRWVPLGSITLRDE